MFKGARSCGSLEMGKTAAQGAPNYVLYNLPAALFATTENMLSNISISSETTLLRKER